MNETGYIVWVRHAAEGVYSPYAAETLAEVLDVIAGAHVSMDRISVTREVTVELFEKMRPQTP